MGLTVKRKSEIGNAGNDVQHRDSTKKNGSPAVEITYPAPWPPEYDPVAIIANSGAPTAKMLERKPVRDLVPPDLRGSDLKSWRYWMNDQKDERYKQRWTQAIAAIEARFKGHPRIRQVTRQLVALQRRIRPEWARPNEKRQIHSEPPSRWKRRRLTPGERKHRAIHNLKAYMAVVQRASTFDQLVSAVAKVNELVDQALKRAKDKRGKIALVPASSRPPPPSSYSTDDDEEDDDDI